MTDESYSFTAAKTRLDEIVTQVRKKDTSLEKSLDLLEEGVRLANVCTELIDHTDWVTPPSGSPEAAEAGVEAAEPVDASAESAADATDAGAAEATGADSDEATDADAETGTASAASDVEVGDVWSEDEAWAEDSDDDPSDGDDGHGV